MSDYADDKARAVLARAGGDPEHAGPLAQWARERLGSDDMTARVLVAEDGTLVGDARYVPSRDGVGAAYVTSVTDPAHAEVVGLEVGRAVGRLRRLTGKGVIVVSYSDVCRGSGAHAAATAAKARMSGDELRALREAMGMTGTQLADALEVRADTLRAWEKGRDPIPYGLARDLDRVCTERIDTLTAVRERLRARP